MNRNRKGKKSKNSYDPFGMNINQEEEQMMDFGLEGEPNESLSQTLVNKLRSFDPQIRELATSSLANLSHGIDAVTLKEIISSDSVKILVERLSDPDTFVSINSLHAVRNLIEVCSNQDLLALIEPVLTPSYLTYFISLFQTLCNTLEAQQNPQNLMQGSLRVEVVEDALASFCSLFAMMFDSLSIELLKRAEFVNIIKLAVEFITKLRQTPARASLLSLLQSATESLDDACGLLANDETFTQFMFSVLNTDAMNQWGEKASVCMVLYNILNKIPSIPVKIRDEITVAITNFLSGLLSIKVIDEVENLVKIIRVNQPSDQERMKLEKIEEEELEMTTRNQEANNLNNDLASTKNNSEHTKELEEEEEKLPGDEDDEEEEIIEELGPDGRKKKKVVKKKAKAIRLNGTCRDAIRIWHTTISAFETALGLLINIYQVSEDDIEEEEINDLDDAPFEESKQQTNGQSMMGGSKFADSLPHPCLSDSWLALLDQKTLGRLAELTKQPAIETMGLLFEWHLEEEIISHIFKINKLSTAAVLNFVVDILLQQQIRSQPEAIDLAADLQNILWPELMSKLRFLDDAMKNRARLRSSDDDWANFQDVLTNILRTTSTIAKELRNEKTLGVLDTETTLALANSGPMKESRENAQAIMDLVACRFDYRMNIKEIDVIENVSKVLLGGLQEDDMLKNAYALNAIFEVFGENNYDQVFYEKNYPEILAMGACIFKDKFEEVKSSLTKEDRNYLKETFINLKRFIKYKQDNK